MNATDDGGHVEIELAALVTSGGHLMPPNQQNLPEICQKSLLSLLLLLSRFVLIIFNTNMFPFTEGWLHAKNIGPAAQAL